MLLHQRIQSSMARAISSKRQICSLANGGGSRLHAKTLFLDLSHQPLQLHRLSASPSNPVRRLLCNESQCRNYGNKHRPSPLERLVQRKLEQRRQQLQQQQQQEQQWSEWPEPPNTEPSTLVRRTIVWGFIGLNIIVFIKWQQAKQKHQEPGQATTLFPLFQQQNPTTTTTTTSDIWDMHANWLLTIPNFNEGRWWTLLTSTASHENLPHLILNMYAYHVFTNFALSMAVRPTAVVGVALGSAVTGSAASLWDFGRRPAAEEQAGLGASGLVCGLAAYMTCRAPFTPFTLMFIPVPVPLCAITLGLLAFDLYGAGSDLGWGFGHAAHLGGTAFGTLAYAARRLVLRF